MGGLHLTADCGGGAVYGCGDTAVAVRATAAVASINPNAQSRRQGKFLATHWRILISLPGIEHR